jgi:adenylate cyclase
LAKPAFRLSEECLVCGLPLSGAFGGALQWIGIGRSSRNPNCCTRCNTHIEEGRLVEITMLFADLSSFTEMTNRLGAESTYGIVDEYLRFASGVLTGHGAFIDKYIGDAVMAFFNAPVKRADHAQAAVAAARELQEKLPALSERLGLKLQATIGIATGFARVGRLGSDDIKDYTAIGEVVNQAARLQAQAHAGEIVVTEGVYRTIAAEFPGIPAESLTLKGFRESCVAYRLNNVSSVPSEPARQEVMSRKSVGLGTLMMALLGAGCLGAPIIGTLALTLGAGSAALIAARGVLLWLDRSVLHIPLLVAAGAMALASLASLHREHLLRRACEARGACIAVTPKEKRHNLIVAGLSFAALTFVVLEFCVHFFFHGSFL